MAGAGKHLETGSSYWDYRSETFAVEAAADFRNKRLWVSRCRYRDITEMQKYLYRHAVKLGLEKIILPVKEGETEKYGLFRPEGRINGYFNSVNAIFLTCYTLPRRGLSAHLQAQASLLADVMKKEYNKRQFSHNYDFRKASIEDAGEMTGVFSMVFDSYPSPVFQPDYLVGRMQAGDIFWLAHRGGKIAAICSAEIDFLNSRAEMTDFATLPGHRGQGLASVLLEKIEEECRALGIRCLFSLARASSFGMNSVFYRHGYTFGGTLINNCHICGRYENMNIWYLQE